jgi:hypothetical protein
MQNPTPPEALQQLTRALVQHLHELLAQYPEGSVLSPQADEEFSRWLARAPRFPGPLPVGVCARSALGGPLSHALEEVHDSGGVLVVCDVTDGSSEAIGRSVELMDHIDLIEVRHPSEIAGAVVEALAGDVPLVLDVRLTRGEGATLFPSVLVDDGLR